MIGACLVALALGSELEGRVTDDRGLGLQGVLVLAYDDRARYEYDYSGLDGAFRIEGLDTEPRRVRFIAPDAVDAVEMYLGGLPELCDSEIVVPPARGALDLGVIRMARGGVVRGRVLGADGEPVVGAEVASRPAGITPISLARSAWTDEDGAFELRGVPVLADGTAWNLEVIPVDAPEQFLGGAFGAEAASVFEVDVGSPVDVGEWTLSPGGSLSGTVVGPAGPVVEGTVSAVTVGRTWTAPVVDGAWEIPGLPPGQARVWVSAEGLGTTFWPDASVPGATVPVSDGVATEGVELRMRAEGRYVGRLKSPDDLTGSTITLIDPARSVQATGEVAADGSFEVDGLGEGAWRVEVTPEIALDHVSGPLLTAEGNLVEVALQSGKTFEAGEVDLPRGAVVRGAVRDRGTGDPIYGAWVYVENASTGTTRLVYSGRKGRFDALQLPAGVYRIHAEYEPYCKGDRDWTNRHYPDQRNGVLTGTVPLAAGQVLRWTPDLPVDSDHDRMGDNWEASFGLKVGRNDGNDDLDGDGFVNVDEYLLGTDPSDASGGCGGGSWLVLLPVAAFSRRRSRDRGSHIPHTVAMR